MTYLYTITPMQKSILVKLLHCLLLGISLLIAEQSFAFSYQRGIWGNISAHFKLSNHTQHARIKEQIQWFRDRPYHLQQLAKQATPYLFYIHQEVRKQGLPGELTLIPMIESNYDPFALSHVGAAGIWQLMPGTASGLGLRQDWWYDERRDIQSSTQAAIRYLTELHQFFNGDWLHTIAAYHSGAGTVQKAIRRNEKQGKATDFWSLKLPRETQVYVPRLLALASTIKQDTHDENPLPPIDNKPYFASLSIDKPIDLTQVADLADVSLDELYRLNPGYNHWFAISEGPHSLNLPIAKARAFENRINELPDKPDAKWQQYRVQQGDTLGHIAARYHVSTAQLKRLNHLKSDTLQINQALIIASKPPAHKNSKIANKRQQLLKRAEQVGPQKAVHIVQDGDTLSDLAKRYAVKTAEIRFWNQLPYRHTLQANQQLVMWKKKPVRKIKTIKHHVQNGETLSHIALHYHVSINDIKRWNKQLAAAKYLRSGDKLRIYRQ